MNIELVNPTTVKITWPHYDTATEAEIVARLATVPGIDGRPRRYYAPTIQTARLMELFPKASFDYAAVAAGDALALTFYESLVWMGIEFYLDASGCVISSGEANSPVIEQLTAERSHALRWLVAEAANNPRPVRQPARSLEPVQGPLTANDARLQPLLLGIENAKRRDEERAIKYPKRRRSTK